MDREKRKMEEDRSKSLEDRMAENEGYRKKSMNDGRFQCQIVDALEMNEFLSEANLFFQRITNIIFYLLVIQLCHYPKRTILSSIWHDFLFMEIFLFPGNTMRHVGEKLRV